MVEKIEYLDEVFIKAMVDSGIDQVLIVKNLPKHLIYTWAPAQIPRYDRDGYTDGTMMSDPSGKMIEVLKEGLSYSQTKDRSIVFNCGLESGKLALAAITRYIETSLPRDVVVPKMVPYPIDPSDTRSAARNREDIPVVELPKDSKEEVSQVSPATKVAPESPSLISDTSAKRREALAKARAAKAAKKAQV
jgi:hypothetical protein